MTKAQKDMRLHKDKDAGESRWLVGRLQDNADPDVPYWVITSALEEWMAHI